MATPKSDPHPDPNSRRIAIIGAGPGGLCMGIKLQEAGLHDFVILEKADGVGGTWYHNRYPGCACDIPSFLYSFSFEPRCDWSRPYGTQPEILEYMEQVAEKYGLLPHCRFGSGVHRAEWDEGRAVWALTLESGERLQADVVVSAIGMFNDLSLPAIEGLEDFGGTMFHSARWDFDHDLTGDRVGVIGSAASAVQFIPEIVKQAGHVYLHQRTANWVLPKQDEPYSEEELAHFRTHPEAIRALRREMWDRINEGMTFSDPAMLAEMEGHGLANLDLVEDPETRKKLRPQHPYGCKRPLLSNEFYPAFNRPNLELITDSIVRITRDSIVTRTDDGRETAREIDTLILATGFSATRYVSALDVTGRNGLPIDEAWNDGATAFLGITTAGFPNLFMLYGPNTNNGSILEMIESQVDHVVRQIDRIRREDLAWIDVRPEPMARWNADLQQAISGVRVWQESCNGYYRTPAGRIVTQWPFSMHAFRERTKSLESDAFEVGLRSDRSATTR